MKVEKAGWLIESREDDVIQSLCHPLRVPVTPHLSRSSSFILPPSSFLERHADCLDDLFEYSFGFFTAAQ